MTTGYLYLGPESVAWIDTDNQLLAKSESSSMPGLSDKLDYLQSYLVQNPDSSIHLIVGSSLEEVRWQSSASRRTSLASRSLPTTPRPPSPGREPRAVFGRQTKKPRRSIENELTDSQGPDPLRVRQVFSAIRQRKLGLAAIDVCPQTRTLKNAKKLIRDFEITTDTETLAWYEAASMVSAHEPLLISHTLLLESIQQSKRAGQTTLLIVKLEDGFERHIYLSKGLVCLSRLVAIEETGSTSEKVRSDTIQHLARTFRSDNQTDKKSEAVSRVTDLWGNPLDHACGPDGELSSDVCVHEFLEKHIGKPAASFASVVPSPVLKTVVVENCLIADQKAELQRQNRNTLLRGAVGFSLTGLLLWQLIQLYGASKDLKVSQAQLLLEQVELNQLQGLQSSSDDSVWKPGADDAGYRPEQMKYVVEAGRFMHRHSILFPAACLLRIQEIKAGVPDLELNRIEWRRDSDQIVVNSDNETSALQFMLSGHINESLSPLAGLQLFESFLQSLLNGFNLQSVDQVRYPYDADPHSQIRANFPQIKDKTAFEIKITVSPSSVSELIMMVESLVPKV